MPGLNCKWYIADHDGDGISKLKRWNPWRSIPCLGRRNEWIIICCEQNKSISRDNYIGKKEAITKAMNGEMKVHYECVTAVVSIKQQAVE